MSQPISVSVQMDAASFHDFAAFDLLRHRKAWHRPLVFTAILLVSAGVCLSQGGQKDGAALLTVLLAVVAVQLIRVYGQLGEAKTQRETVSQQLQEQKKENSDLESDLSKADDKEFIKGLAKDQLGLAEDGERIFYDVNH